ncbi:5-formyltetrahydrofolate cyclo-ligase-like [Argiope bruennichi]|uniref:5-formyltetrahydrofolate cyclo-ligase-like n=1 Tax=Argiope bruennichi TaxID=94029 RepID=UPI002494196F|nr:5-formyltetrahydrofolate cyclo-ligase-like [Argiope bruennichi]XP_055946423.1 5-formyltetrahydrofolate cyclo-ligase-like [Argiope bruennichi]
MALQAAKKALRAQLKEILKSLPTEEKARQSKTVVNKLLQSKKYQESQRISVYLSRDIEIDTRAVLADIFRSGKECFIPRYDSKSMAMDMVKLNSLQDYENLPVTSWNIKQPNYSDPNLQDALSTGGLDLIIVPGIGFTKEGHRIGNGKGYYDSYLQMCKEKLGNRFSTVALAFREQVVSSIPISEHDVLIDEVIYPD